MDHILRDRGSLVAALGAGVVVGVSGIYMYYRMNKNMTREISHLAGTIDTLKREISDLREREEIFEATPQDTLIKRTGRSVRRVPQSQRIRNSVNNEAECSSATSTDYRTASEATLVNGILSDDEEEFYDFSDSEQDDGTVDPALSEGDGDKWLEFCDRKLEDMSNDMGELYTQMKQKKSEYANRPDYLWRLTKVTHFAGIIVQGAGDVARKRELAFEAQKYASEALKLDPEDAECHKWYAVAIGSLSEFVGTQQKIQNGYEFKRHVDIAVKLKPQDPTLHHMLGRWCYEVAQLSWVERKLASTLYSTPPQSSLHEARVHLFEADKLRPAWKENMLYIAKTYIGDANYVLAISWLDRAVLVPAVCEADKIAHKQVLALQQTYAKYRE